MKLPEAWLGHQVCALLGTQQVSFLESNSVGRNSWKGCGLSQVPRPEGYSPELRLERLRKKKDRDDCLTDLV